MVQSCIVKDVINEGIRSSYQTFNGGGGTPTWYSHALLKM